jgi:flavin-dependent dehydrogenase
VSSVFETVTGKFDTTAKETKVAVIGAGISGSMLACYLARANIAVDLYEKEAGAHHKVCGEFFSYETVAYLAEIGIDLARLEATKINEFNIYSDSLKLASALPESARGLSRFKLDQALIKHAESLGACVFKGKPVTEAQLIDLDYAHIIQASGKNNYSKVINNYKAKKHLGFKMYYQLSKQAKLELENKVKIFLYQGGYAGLSFVEDEQANLCFIIETNVFNQHASDYISALEYIRSKNHFLSETLDRAKELWAKPLLISNIPYGYLRPANNTPSKSYIGDTLAVTPSLMGNGMAIACASARLIAKKIIKELKPEAKFSYAGAGFHNSSNANMRKTDIKDAHIEKVNLTRNDLKLALKFSARDITLSDIKSKVYLATFIHKILVNYKLATLSMKLLNLYKPSINYLIKKTRLKI